MCRLIVFLFFYRILFVIWKHIQLVYGDDELQKIAVTFIKRKMMKRLENASKHAAATATQCIAASQGAGTSNFKDS